MRGATRTSLALLGALALLPLGGCLDINFDAPHLVKSDRILGIRVEPPEVPFGEDVRFEALLVSADGRPLTEDPEVTVRWTVCLSLAEIFSAAGLGASSDLTDTCGEGGPDLVVLEADPDHPERATIPGAAFFALAAQLPMGGGMEVPGVDPELGDTLIAVLSEVGIAMRVRLEVRRGSELLFTGFKRFALAMREDLTSNPPPPRFAVNGVWLTARTGGNPRFCVPEEGEPPVVAPEAEADLTPDEDDAEWMETYPVFNLNGVIQQNRESAYYSWFSTAGAMSADITQAPNRDAVWTAPEEPGLYPIWLVVRDGHLGASWCLAEVEVR